MSLPNLSCYYESMPLNNKVLTIDDVIHESGSLGKCLEFKYEGAIRTVEGYSLRPGKTEPLLYAFCLDAQAVRAFKLSKISDAHVSDRALDREREQTKDWVVEIGTSHDSNEQEGI